ncbi:MAG: hypothetical protein SFY67_05260 [Candidatus Melainabacteria bacterium]|nr:hypothetical protein [Candidatus Melainabacteria bacterium]
MPKQKTKFQEFVIFVRDLCIVMVLGAGLAVGGYFIGKNNGHNHALTQLNNQRIDSASQKPLRKESTEKVK